ncbi:MAG: hydroxymethylglutaryl-CoA synthase [Sulfolobales archaeon]
MNLKGELPAIYGWGSYIPVYRIKLDEIARAWGNDPAEIKRGLQVEEISVKGPDEDQVAIAVNAAWNALRRAPEVSPKDIGAVYVGSESKPYAVKPTATIVAAAVGAPVTIRAADYEFACKAGTEAVISVIAQVASGMIKYGLAIGADTSQSWPGDVLEYTAGAGGSAFVIGPKSTTSVAYFESQYSVATDTPDFWRRDEIKYPRHMGRFTGEPAYFKHIMLAANELMSREGLKPSDFDYFVPHQPNGTFPIRVALRLGFKLEQVKPGLISPWVGNLYSGSSLTGLSRVLDKAKPGQRILLVSYGSGAGADAFSIVTQEAIEEKKRLAPTVDDYINRKKYIDYSTYLRFWGKIYGVRL